MEQLNAAAFFVGLFGGIFDLLTRRVPNWITFPAMLIGLVAQFWFSDLAGVGQGILGILLGFGIFFPVYALGYMGAGDVKLMMAVGAFGGWQFCWRTAIASVVFGGAFALGDVLFRGRLVAVARNTYSFLRSVLVPGLVPEPLQLDKERKFTFGICIALGAAAVIYLQHSGRLT